MTYTKNTLKDTFKSLKLKSVGQILVRFWLEYYIMAVFLVIVVISRIIFPRFLSQANVFNILRQSSVLGIVAFGMLLVIMTAGIDLSVGSLVALTGVLAVGLQRNMPLVFALILSLAIGLFAGLVNGLLIAKRKMPPFITTMGMMAIARGLTYVYTHGGPIQINYPEYNFLGRGMLGPMPFIVIVWLIISIILFIIITQTTFGRSIKAIGSNPTAVHLSGINVSRHVIIVYMLSGLLCGIGGILLTSRITVGTPLIGVGMELEAIASVVIGGASLSGGRGTVFGTIIGVLILGVISNMLNLVGVSMFYQDTVRGSIIILAVLFKIAREH